MADHTEREPSQGSSSSVVDINIPLLQLIREPFKIRLANKLLEAMPFTSKQMFKNSIGCKYVMWHLIVI